MPLLPARRDHPPRRAAGPALVAHYTPMLLPTYAAAARSLLLPGGVMGSGGTAAPRTDRRPPPPQRRRSPAPLPLSCSFATLLRTHGTLIELRTYRTLMDLVPPHRCLFFCVLSTTRALRRLDPAAAASRPPLPAGSPHSTCAARGSRRQAIQPQIQSRNLSRSLSSRRAIQPAAILIIAGGSRRYSDTTQRTVYSAQHSRQHGASHAYR